MLPCRAMGWLADRVPRRPAAHADDTARAEVDPSWPRRGHRVSRRRVTPLARGAAHMPSHCLRDGATVSTPRHSCSSPATVRCACLRETRPRLPVEPTPLAYHGCVHTDMIFGWAYCVNCGEDRSDIFCEPPDHCDRQPAESAVAGRRPDDRCLMCPYEQRHKPISVDLRAVASEREWSSEMTVTVAGVTLRLARARPECLREGGHSGRRTSCGQAAPTDTTAFKCFDW